VHASLVINVASKFCSVATTAHQVVTVSATFLGNTLSFLFSTVCGEDCTLQICPICAPQGVKEKIVDLILYRTLEDIASNEQTLDELLITIPKCNHVFTVETLDGHCRMNDYYKRDGIDGKWLTLKTPDDISEERKTPVCPTCRSAITSPRYGRAFKSADLDILERNVISRMSQSLHRVQVLIDEVSVASIGEALNSEAQNIVISPAPIPAQMQKSCRRARGAIIKEQRESPAAVETINPGNDKLFIVYAPVSIAWRKATRRLTNIYNEARKIALMRSVHLNAWEAAFSCLYQQEMDHALSNPAQAPRRPMEFALRMARMKVGLPQPRADKRFLVEAFWTTLKIRFILADLAQVWLNAVSSKGETYPTQERQMWATYALFLLDTCARDAQIAFDIAQQSESRRQMTITSLLIMRADLERFRLNVEMARQSKTINVGRTKLIETACQKAQAAEDTISSTVKYHLTVLPNDDHDWLATNFTGTARTIVDEWWSIERSVRSDTYYAPVSLDERMAIVKAFNFCTSVIWRGELSDVLTSANSTHWSLLQLSKWPYFRHHGGVYSP